MRLRNAANAKPKNLSCYFSTLTLILLFTLKVSMKQLDNNGPMVGLKKGCLLICSQKFNIHLEMKEKNKNLKSPAF
jgi:hypothetical protein